MKYIKHGLQCSGCYQLPDFINVGYCVECPHSESEIKKRGVWDGDKKICGDKDKK